MEQPGAKKCVEAEQFSFGKTGTTTRGCLESEGLGLYCLASILLWAFASAISFSTASFLS